MNKNVLIAIADGSEEIEAVTPIDLLRRAGFNVLVAGERDIVTCSRGVKIVSDVLLEEISGDSLFDLIVLPGGGTGTENLMANKHLKLILQTNKFKSNIIAAICAAPTILTEHNLIEKNAKLTSYPSMKDEFENYDYCEDSVVVHKNFVTSRAVGTAIEFSLKLIEMLAGYEKAKKVADAIVYPY
jgi:protein deglycase